jgi:hypothetical protein
MTIEYDQIGGRLMCSTAAHAPRQNAATHTSDGPWLYSCCFACHVSTRNVAIDPARFAARAANLAAARKDLDRLVGSEVRADQGAMELLGVLGAGGLGAGLQRDCFVVAASVT